MSHFAYADGAAPSGSPVLPGVVTLQRRMLWLIGASSSIVLIEPSPYEVTMALGVILFLSTGLRMSATLMVPLTLLAAINIGYSVASINLFTESEVLYWVLTSWYMAIAASFFALALAEDTGERLEALSRGYVVAAVIASLAGIVGYFTASDLLTWAGRARGTFKDPNVLGAFLIYPAVYCIQRIINGSFWGALRSGLALGIISLAIFLAFSRAAWGLFAGATFLTVLLMYLTANTHRERIRIVMLAILTMVVGIMALAILLSFDPVSSLFKERASLSQPYDGGRFGRFGRHLLGAGMALDHPLGIGPLQFRLSFPEDTHNSFLNAFMSGGWLSGILYPVLIVTTAIYGFRSVFKRTPWQKTYIAVFATLFVTIIENFIIDSDHWRHFYMLLGVTWGVVVACSARSTIHHA